MDAKYGDMKTYKLENASLVFKHILMLKSTTPSFMVYGEAVRFPIHNNVHSNMSIH